MEIIVRDEKKVSEFQYEFSHAFPYLKIDFFKQGSLRNVTLPGKMIVDGESTFGKFRMPEEKQFRITSDTTITDLEKGFKECYGLLIQVFRRSGKAWLETKLTDTWTLENQNKQGEILSKDK